MHQSPWHTIKHILDIVVSFCLISVSVAIIVFAIMYFRNSKNNHTQASTDIKQVLQRGSRLNISALRKTTSDHPQRVLLIALQTGCRFCKESIPLYQALAQHADKLNAKLVFVFFQPLQEARKYLESNSIDNVDIQQISFRDIHVNGTPTLILLNADNQILEAIS